MAELVLTGAATAGNANMDFVVPVNVRWRILYGKVLITTDAIVANRFIRMDMLNQAGASIMDFHAGTAVTASQTSQHCGFMQGIYRETAFVDSALQVPLGHDARLLSLWTLRVYVGGGVAGDSFSATIMVDEY
jgi:hypothetical protein